MIKRILSNSGIAASAVYLDGMSEPMLLSEKGIYIGRTLTYNIPVMLDSAELLNPHIAIIGMTGSGKSYMMKTIIAKSVLRRHYKLLVIDWNSEYTPLICLLGGIVVRIAKDQTTLESSEILDGVYSIDLAYLQNDTERKRAACSMIQLILECMHKKNIGRQTDTLVVIDEIWKLAGSSELAKLFREARKYGISIAASTQLGSDMANEIVANAATLAIFRIQNEADLDQLINLNIIDSTHRVQLSSFGVGSCLMHLAYAGSKQVSRFVINKVDGMPIDALRVNANTKQLAVAADIFAKQTQLLCNDPAALVAITNYIEENSRNIELQALIALLVKHGLKRDQIVPYLKLLGIDDIDIIMSYESVTRSQMVVVNDYGTD